MRSKLLVTAALVALLGGGGTALAADPVLTADVGQSDGFTIGLADASGSPVKHLDAGTYSLVVHDHSSFHNFHLSGPGVDVATDVDGIGDRTFTVTLGDGKFFFQCDPHSSQMKGSFTVGAVVDTPPPPARPARLAASIGPGKRFSLGPAASFVPGAVVVTVADRSVTDGFRLAGPGVAKSTGARFRGTATWKLTLKPGTYRFGSLRNAKLRKTFVVS